MNNLDYIVQRVRDRNKRNSEVLDGEPDFHLQFKLPLDTSIIMDDNPSNHEQQNTNGDQPGDDKVDTERFNSIYDVII